jgi:hypothetical protein
MARVPAARFVAIARVGERKKAALRRDLGETIVWPLVTIEVTSVAEAQRDASRHRNGNGAAA